MQELATELAGDESVDPEAIKQGEAAIAEAPSQSSPTWAELQWDQSFRKTQTKLVEVARLAKQQIAKEQGQAMDYDQL